VKVLLVGGAGVFGSRLARLLVRDGHEVTLAGRTPARAQPLAEELGCATRRLDRTGDLTDLAGYDVLVDAAGPFHTGGEDPYRLARAALAAGLHYLDLCDNAAFCAGIAALDDEARAAGLCAVSGLSSVPAISSAAVRALCGEERPRVIETAILPGNRSPRGPSVMQSILSQAGRPAPVWRGGAWEQVPGWSDPKDYVLPGDGGIRQGWQISVPDQLLFPAHFGAQTVVFRAGLELWVMRYGLAVFALLRRLWPFPVTGPVLRVFRVLADLLAPFGSGRGGMSVMVIAGQERLWWRLLAEEGDGPFVPAVAAAALLRRAVLPVGARPALEVITLNEAEAVMAGLRIRTERSAEPLSYVFPRVLGASFDDLPAKVRATHLTDDVSRWQGASTVHRGKSLWSRVLGRLFGFPSAGRNIPVEVVKTVTPRGETWQRRFGQRVFRSRLAATPEGLTESFGPFTFQIGLEVRDGALHYPVRAGRLGPVALPRWFLPVSEAREYVQDGQFCFDVKLFAPLTGDLMVHYRGHLSAAETSRQLPEA